MDEHAVCSTGALLSTGALHVVHWRTVERAINE